ncbi:MAG TPA: phosphate ABC transporter substrate-binding protein PstS [Candidatus Acidoferrales bacterium]|nr:phosphate ABC transporter substrate-binding protein PstS [Candidatus Acidoferrales bacterium]
MQKRFLMVVAAVFVSAALLHGQTVINGAGSTFIYPMFSKWSNDYHKAHPDVEINYQSIGSGGGINQLTAGTVEIGASDAPLNDQQIAACEKAHGPVVHLPEAMGAVAVSYHIPGVDATLKFTGEVIANIYLGNITKWDDPAIKGLNPDVNLPDQQIVVVHRSDGSGDTYIFVDYLCKVSQEWKDKVGKGTSVNWPVGIGAKGNEGVTGQVEQTPYSIGYVTLIYALQNNVPFGSVKNKEGEFIHPTIESVSDAAANAAKIVPADLRFSITDAPGKTSYPISSATWLIVYVNQTDEKIAEETVKFLNWVLTDGQKMEPALDYAPIPKPIQKMELELLQKVNYDGKSLM